ncbi:hypothetical protein [Georgenia sp. AZ-5]|uniref:hypothetical protein n=1 Tax=Georgenia sp. AZ-5 TaxID=3367526 RepID=UPI00375512CF
MAHLTPELVAAARARRAAEAYRDAGDDDLPRGVPLRADRAGSPPAGPPLAGEAEARAWAIELAS